MIPFLHNLYRDKFNWQLISCLVFHSPHPPYRTGKSKQQSHKDKQVQQKTIVKSHSYLLVFKKMQTDCTLNKAYISSTHFIIPSPPFYVLKNDYQKPLCMSCTTIKHVFASLCFHSDLSLRVSQNQNCCCPHSAASHPAVTVLFQDSTKE